MKTFAFTLQLHKAALAAGLFLSFQALAQTILFDFENAPLYSPFPIDVTVGGVTAHFSATGQGYSIQSSSTAPVVPAGFSGHFIYPSSVFAADLQVAFSKPITNFSILYAPEELGCDDSARMRVTAYMNSNFVGTATTTARYPGTYPAETLSFSSTRLFNNVVVHYDAKPPTCQDWGPIFLADNMSITPAADPPPLQISSWTNHIEIAWPAGAVAFVLQVNTNLLTTNTWLTVTNEVVVNGAQNIVSIAVEPGLHFYRLTQ